MVEMMFSIISGSPFKYEECLLDYSVGIGKDKVTQASPTIPNSAMWASSYSNDRRMPWMARLAEPNGKPRSLKHDLIENSRRRFF